MTRHDAAGGTKLALVMPVLNDWPSLEVLLARIDAQALPRASVDVFVVDDGSTEPAPATLAAAAGQGAVASVSVVELSCNVGHQRAIALGVAHVSREHPAHFVLVMDSDGEDDPAYLPQMLERIAGRANGIVVAERAERSEGGAFRAGYVLYRALFRVLVGRDIKFGNFALAGPAAARRLAHMPETWNHFAAALLRSRLRLDRVATRRGTRIAGRSSMNFPALVVHGLSALSVFSDHVLVRMLMLAGTVGLVTMASAIGVAVVRFATDLATPGWATMAIGLSVVVFLQTLLVTLLAAVQVLAARSQAVAQPATLAGLFVERVTRLPLGALRQQALAGLRTQ
jgi:hypothetical protein